LVLRHALQSADMLTSLFHGFSKLLVGHVPVLPRRLIVAQFPKRSYFNPFVFFLLWIAPAIIFLVVVKCSLGKLLKRRRQRRLGMFGLVELIRLARLS
jgi:hypothetical protein